MLSRENVDLRFPYLCFCFHIHSDGILPNSLIVLISQLLDLTSPVCQNLLEGKRVLLVIYIVEEEKTIFLLSMVPGAMQIKLKNRKTGKWEKRLITVNKEAFIEKE